MARQWEEEKRQIVLGTPAGQIKWQHRQTRCPSAHIYGSKRAHVAGEVGVGLAARTVYTYTRNYASRE